MQAIELLISDLRNVALFQNKTLEELKALSFTTITNTIDKHLKETNYENYEDYSISFDPTTIANDLFTLLHKEKGTILNAVVNILSEPWQVMCFPLALLKQIKKTPRNELMDYLGDIDNNVTTVLKLIDNEFKYINNIAQIAADRPNDEKWKWFTPLKECQAKDPWSFLLLPIPILHEISCAPTLDVACALNSSLNSAKQFKKAAAKQAYRMTLIK